MDAVIMHTKKAHMLRPTTKKNKTESTFCITYIAFFLAARFTLHQLARTLSVYWIWVLAQGSGPSNSPSKALLAVLDALLAKLRHSEYPSAQVIGTDLSPIQPPWVPPNCVFEIDDFESDWLYKNKFDFIHGRELEGCVADEERLFRQAFEHLRPGGYLEWVGAYAWFFSDDGTDEKAEYTKKWLKLFHEAAGKFGKSFETAPTWKEKMEKVGFVDVKQTVFKVPFGPWPKDQKLKEIGRFEQVQQIQAVEAYTPALLSRFLGWSNDEIQVLIAKVRSELKDPAIHQYITTYVVYGRKPEEKS
ncbi:hypothetical protein T310_0313 [Rasamsonia emersonii CBS 393.64]|uniref:UMTA methyltransferase family protein n=1 Tax=Rasamsonia emersonii (strain ATCC 16479 / CBS 393.64 / IMI 116815) TaxID=1408163 RepID=A0A0F4Z735_RASE3|nr:hypothetical protein T310_0313 [Rasamsonia emersonii CBS 393.64]KKA25673.1 hypothetical protein T310_0313 [Rasamsonia emersonii CBS 393.64]